MVTGSIGIIHRISMFSGVLNNMTSESVCSDHFFSASCADLKICAGNEAR